MFQAVANEIKRGAEMFQAVANEIKRGAEMFQAVVYGYNYVVLYTYPAGLSEQQCHFE